MQLDPDIIPIPPAPNDLGSRILPDSLLDTLIQFKLNMHCSRETNNLTIATCQPPMYCTLEDSDSTQRIMDNFKSAILMLYTPVLKVFNREHECACVDMKLIAHLRHDFMRYEDKCMEVHGVGIKDWLLIYYGRIPANNKAVDIIMAKSMCSYTEVE